jgi:hypothetical protein
MGKPTDIPDIKVDEEYAIRNQTSEEKEKWEGADVPEYRIQLDLNEEQKSRLMKQVKAEFDALKKEREELGLTKKWEERDAQYDGQLAPIKFIEFAIDVRESKIKVDTIVRALKEAFLPEDGDIVDVSPRPDTARKDGWQIAEKQQQFIDFAMDEEVKPEMAFSKVFTSGVKKFVGIMKQVWAYKQEIRRREEHWEGKLVQVDTKPDGTPIMFNEGLRNFLNMYPDAPKRYPAQVKKLLAGESIDIVVAYKEQIDNNPEYKYIKIEDFYVRNCCDYNKGLRYEHLITERQDYSYWELKKKEANEEFKDVGRLFDAVEGNTDDAGGSDFMTKTYDVMEHTTYFRINENDEDETKIKLWTDEDVEDYLGAEQYPYYSIDCDYTGFWPKENDKGFYGNAESIMYDLRDTHIAQDALISLVLHSIYIRNIITPIVRSGSDAETMFLDHDFKNGKPIPVDDLTDDVGKAFGFVQWPVTDTNGGLAMLEKLKRIGSDVSRVTDLVTGNASELDPSAPASKTIALLQQSGMGIKEYIKNILPSFNITASNLLQLYYQMSTEDRKYRIRQKSKQVTGKDIFENIKREEMVVKTNIQSRAATFVFDKVNEKREALVALQSVQNSPYLQTMPEVQWKAFRIFMSTFGGRWKTFADSDLPSPDQFKKQQMGVAMQAIAALFQQAQAQSEVTGVPPDGREVMSQAPDAVTKAQALAFNPRLAEGEQK